MVLVFPSQLLSRGVWVFAIVLAAHFRVQPGWGCNISEPQFQVNIPITLHSCGERSGAPQGACIKNPTKVVNTDFRHRGSELNDGALQHVGSDEECCQLCQNTPGCATWSRIQDADQFNELGACWMKSAVPERTPTRSISAGIVPPIVLDRVACNPMKNVGFKYQIEYNHPELLLTADAETCCLRCQEQNSLCYGWMWMMGNRRCHLYGTPIPSSAEFLCRNCVSGHHSADRDKVRDGCLGSAGELYAENGRIVLAPKGAFATTTSKECCGLCDAARECRSWSWNKYTQECSLVGDVPEKQRDVDYFGGISGKEVCKYEACDIVEGVTMLGRDLFCSQFAAPYGNRLVVPSAEECCAMCQRYPECAAWTFTKGDVTQSSTACWLKHSIPDTAQKPLGGGSFATGIVRSRLTGEDIENFLNTVKNAVEIDANRADQRIDPDARDRNGNGGDFDTSGGGGGIKATVIITIVVVIVGLMLLCCIAWIIMLKLSKKKTKKFNAERKKVLQHRAEQGLTFDSTSLVENSAMPHSVWLSTQNASIDAEPDDAKQEQLVQLKQKIQQAGKAPGIDGAPLLALDPGTVLGGKYIIEEGSVSGNASHVLNAKQKFGHALAVTMKFYTDGDAHQTELKFFSQQLLPQYVPQVFDMFEDSTVASWGLPSLPCIVMERGDNTLRNWLTTSRATMDTMDQRNILFRVCTALQSLHQHGIVHRSVSPDNILLYRSSMSWKLVDFEWWAKRGSKALVEYSLRYAPPEMLLAHARGDPYVIAKPAIDMWALGLIFWEVLSGEALFSNSHSDEEVMAMLLGVEPLPFEKDINLWGKINHPAARRLVANLLHRNPNARYPVNKVLLNAYFLTGTDTVQQQSSSHQVEMVKQIAKGVVKIEGQVEQATEVLFENFKHTVGNVLIACFSFYEISPDEFAGKHPSAAQLAAGFKDSTLKFTETLIEPSYNVFKRSKEEPTPLLRLDKKHLVKISLMYGGTQQLELPITEIMYCKIWPKGVDNDVQEVPVFHVSHEGYVLDTVAVWDTLVHSEPTLKLIGDASLVVAIGLKMKSSDRVVEVRKTIEIRMMNPEEKFRLVKVFKRTTEWYANLPPWARLYIHGAAVMVKLASMTVV